MLKIEFLLNIKYTSQKDSRIKARRYLHNMTNKKLAENKIDIITMKPTSNGVIINAIIPEKFKKDINKKFIKK